MNISLTSKFILASLVVVLAGAGCAAGSKDLASSTTPESSNTGNAVPEQAADDHGDGAHAVLAGSRITLDNATSLESGNVNFSFKLYGLDGHEFGPNDLNIAHEKKMHFILVRDDMTNFQHLHPEYSSNKWSASTTVAEQGNYQVYVDVEPVEEKPVTLRVPVTIGGATENAQAPVPNADMSAQSKGVKTLLETDGLLKTNEHETLTFTLTQSDSPVTTIDPYLGAFGHVVLLRHNDADDYIHTHPITEAVPTDGKVSFEAQFPVKGRYTLFAQFNVNGAVQTFPITIDVSEEGEDNDIHEDASGNEVKE